MKARTIRALGAATAVISASMALALASSGSLATAAPPPAAPAQQAPGRYIVVLADGASPAAAARRHGAAADHVYSSALRGYAARLDAAALAAAESDPNVAFVAADGPVTIAKPSGKPGGGKGGGGGSAPPQQDVPTGVRRIGGTLSATAGIDGGGAAIGIDVAVIDTGIDGAHPDLNVVAGVNCSTGRSWADGNGHGTHVAGTVAAADDTQGVVGVAPGVRLHAVRVLNNMGSGSISSVICGIDWVTANADVIEVANMSLSAGGTDDGSCGSKNNDAMHRAICASVAAGVTYVAAAGNEGRDASTSIPAAYDEVITVSALADFNGEAGGGAAATCREDVDDTLASFSNFGADVDIAAPGVCIRSTWPGGGFNTISGTSMAAPHVAGAAALLLVRQPSLTPAQVRDELVRVQEPGPIVDDVAGSQVGVLHVSAL